ncbi:phosphopantetheine-binding protein [Streptomyces sp. NPDC056656]|uniref:phosphopantetheine-binding protein n=1 Tax=Streptomyces sp. NPDC056656 TaxID=3345895 RepID=UPI0036BCC482
MTPDVPDSFGQDVKDLWLEVLGAEADFGSGFLENGGDSFRAVLFTARIFDVTGKEMDYLDVLEATGVEALCALVAGSAAGR